MKSVKIASVLFSLIFNLTSHAHENKCVLIGQDEKEGDTKTTFILEILKNDIGKNILISENGEIFIKTDKIIVVPKDANSASLLHTFEDATQYGSRVAPQIWQCPYCHQWWPLGEKCQNNDCPTNHW